MAFILVHDQAPAYRAESEEARDRQVFVNTRQIVSVEPRSRGCRVTLAGLSCGVFPKESAEDVLSLIVAAEEAD